MAKISIQAFAWKLLQKRISRAQRALEAIASERGFSTEIVDSATTEVTGAIHVFFATIANAAAKKAQGTKKQA